MRGVVLAAGSGGELAALTRATHASLLPVFDRPMIFHALRTLLDADVRDILVVSGGEHADAPRRILRDGAGLGLGRLRHAIAPEDGGEAGALARAERFAAGRPLFVIRAADVFERNLQRPADLFRDAPCGARLVLSRVEDARGHPVARMRAGRVVGIVDRPSRPPSRYAVTGARFYDGSVFERIRRIGARSLCDVDRDYVASRAVEHSVQRGWWIAADRPETLAEASHRAARGGANKL